MKHQPMVRISCDDCQEVSINLHDDPDLDGQLYRLGWEEVGAEHYCPKCKKERELNGRIYDLEEILDMPKRWIDQGYFLIVSVWGNGYRATLEKKNSSFFCGIGSTPELALVQLAQSLEGCRP